MLFDRCKQSTGGSTAVFLRGVVLFIILMVLTTSSIHVHAASTLPPTLPGNPEYLIRVIYSIPTDRLLDYENHPDCPRYNRKIDDAVSRIRSLLETVDDFVNWQITEVFTIPDPSGTRLNFEREANGKGPIKVHIIHGNLETEGKDGYWRDDKGMHSNGGLGPLIEQLFGWKHLNDATKKTVYVFIPDIGVWDESLPGIRGYAGCGQGMLTNGLIL